MKLRYLVPCLALALTSLGARAQVGLYVNPIGIHISNAQTDTGPFAFFGNGQSSNMFYGASIGGYYTAVANKHASLGVDVRDVIVHGNSASLNSFMVGLRVAAVEPVFHFHPYAQIDVGDASSKAPTSIVRISRVMYQGYAGLDHPLAKHVDFRAIEIGYGRAETISSGNFGGPVGFPSSKLLSFSTGLVFRIP